MHLEVKEDEATEVTIIPDNFETKQNGFSGVGGEEVDIASIDYYFVEFCYEEERYEMIDEGECEAKGDTLKTRDITAHVWVKEVIPQSRKDLTMYKSEMTSKGQLGGGAVQRPKEE